VAARKNADHQETRGRRHGRPLKVAHLAGPLVGPLAARLEAPYEAAFPKRKRTILSKRAEEPVPLGSGADLAKGADGATATMASSPREAATAARLAAVQDERRV